MDLNDTARRILAARGIDPHTTPPPEPFSPTAFLADLAHAEFAAGLDARFVNAQADHPQVLDWVDRYRAAPRSAPSLLLIGSTGSGKTHQAVGALRAVVLAAATAGRRLTWRFTTHPDFNADMRPAADDRHLHLFDRCLRADVLVLDDLGAGMVSEWTGDTLHRLVNRRWANCQATIFTSNLPPRPNGAEDRRPNLLDAVGDRIASRLADGIVVRMVGDDRRRSRAGRA